MRGAVFTHDEAVYFSLTVAIVTLLSHRLSAFTHWCIRDALCNEGECAGARRRR
jgi:hypothetical protein